MSTDESRRKLARGAKVAVPTVAALGAGSAIAVAAIPGEDGSIDGCYNRLTGALRVIDSAEQCRSLETAIEWSQRGPAGPQGVPGPPGDTGPAGPQGPAGAAAIANVSTDCEAPTAGAAEMFMKLDGIEGESSDDKHKGEIELESFAFGMKNTGGGGTGGGGGAGKAEFASICFEKRFDRSSPKIFQAAAAGTHVKSAVVTFRRSGKEQQEFLTYKFEDVVFDQYDHSGDQKPQMIEDIGFQYSKFEMAYRQQNPDGSLGPEIKAGWDLKANKAG
jgi:type VI secretion system secreted protein Hcp